MSGLLDFGIGARRRGVYPYLGALLGFLIVIGPAWTTFFPFIMDAYDIDSVTSVTAAMSFMGVGQALLGPFVAGCLADRFGPKVPFALHMAFVICGMACFGVMFSHETWTDSMPWWYAASLSVGFAGGMFSGTSGSVCCKWLPDKPGKALGICFAGATLANLWLPLFARFLIEEHGLADTFQILLGFVLVAMFALGVLPWRQPRCDEGASRDPTGRGAAESKGDFTFQAILKIPSFWLLLASVFFCALGTFSYRSNFSLIIGEQLIGQTLAPPVVYGSVVPLCLSVRAIVSAAGQPLWGRALDRSASPMLLLRIVYIGLAAALLTFPAICNDVLSAASAVALVAVFEGSVYVLQDAVATTLFGTDSAGKLIGLLFAAQSVGQILGPLFGGVIMDVAGSYDLLLLLCSAFLLAALATTFAPSTRHPRQARR